MSEEAEIRRRQLIDSIPEVSIIDDSKENITPRRQGRHTAAFYIDPSERQELYKEGELEFQARLKTLDEQDDPLAFYLEYIQWKIEMYPHEEMPHFDLLKAATSRFTNELRYKHEPRYLKMWIEYAELSDEPIEVYRYLIKMDIGQSLALFYEEYAGHLEEIQEYKDAEEIYELGVEKEAQPLSRLKKNFKVFKERMEERQRRGLTRTRPDYKRQMEALNATGHRTMLGEKTDSRSRISVARNLFSGSHRTLGNEGAATPASSSGFTVYTGPSTSSPTSSSAFLPSFNRTENKVVKEKFAGATLPQAEPVIPLSFKKFTVYQDGDTRPRPVPEEFKAHKRVKKDEVIEKLRDSFLAKQDSFVQSKDSKGRTEYICISKTFCPDTSFEEIRANMQEPKQKERISRFEPVKEEEYTAETLAAMKDVNSIFFVEKFPDEEDLTWTKPFQTFEPIERRSAREND